MSQQIINIPINWDDDAINRCIDKGVVEEVKNDISKKSLKKLGLDSPYGRTDHFDDIVKDCVKELIAENKEYIIEEIISRCCRSLKSTKSYQEAKNNLKEK